MKGRINFALTAVAVAACSSFADGALVSIKLTTNALGLGNADLNDGGTVDPDFAGRFITSPTTGVGSLLFVQTNNLAGQGTMASPLLVTITAKTHLDTTSFPGAWGGPRDYQAGILWISKEDNGLPDGRDEGVGVRAFKVGTGTGATGGLRLFGAGGLAEIEGSKDVSGGTGPTTYDPASPNGAPHVDEEVLFNFAAGSAVEAQSIVVVLSKFEASDRFDLVVNLQGGGQQTYNFAGPGTAQSGALTNPGDSVWHLNFGALSGLNAGDIAESFSITAIDDDPAHPSGTAEHFLVSGFFANINVPAPATGLVLGLFGLLGGRRRRSA